MLSFKPTFSVSSFTFKRLFSSSSLSAIRVVSSVYLRLLIFVPAILFQLALLPILWSPHAKSWLIGKDPDEGLGTEGEGDNRGWDGWLASLTWCTWVWVNSGSWWWTGRPGVLQFIGSQRVGLNWVELNTLSILEHSHCSEVCFAWN